MYFGGLGVYASRASILKGCTSVGCIWGLLAGIGRDVFEGVCAGMFEIGAE